MFSRWIVTNITSACGTLRCRKTRIPCGDQLVMCGHYYTTKKQHVMRITYTAGESKVSELYAYVVALIRFPKH
jgi:hypothetical protein